MTVAWQLIKSLEFGAWQLVKSLDYMVLFSQKTFISMISQILVVMIIGFLTKSIDARLDNYKVDHISTKLKVWVMNTSESQTGIHRNPDRPSC